MSQPKNHQERAERAAERLLVECIDHRGDHPTLLVPIIARETFPAELVQAARKQVSACPECQGDGEVGTGDAFGNPGGAPCDHCGDLRAALALYPKPEKETPE